MAPATPERRIDDPPEPAAAEPARRLQAVSGVAMDRPDTAPRGLVRRRLAFAVAALPAIAAAIYAASAGRAGELRVPASQLTIERAAPGVFMDTVPLKAVATPVATIFIDAPEGGNAEEVLVEDGARVDKGAPVVRLVNPSLMLQAAARESDLLQQMATIKESEATIEQRRVELDTRVADARYRAEVAASEAARQRTLAAEGFASPYTLRSAQEESRFQDERLASLREARQHNEALAAAQRTQLAAQARRVADTLQATRQVTEALLVRAPAAGVLSGLAIKPGQAVAGGARIAQVDSGSSFKLVGALDEFYLPRVAVGQSGEIVEGPGQGGALEVARILPQVAGGRFQVELAFRGAPPPALRRGQSLETRLTLGAETRALLLPNAAFLAESGGAYVYRVDPAGERALRTPVRIGRRNLNVVEVLSGLAAGDRVLTSSYGGYVGHDVLRLDPPQGASR